MFPNPKCGLVTGPDEEESFLHQARNCAKMGGGKPTTEQAAQELAGCGAKHLKKCACGQIYYCSKSCQIAHRPRHRSACTVSGSGGGKSPSSSPQRGT